MTSLRAAKNLNDYMQRAFYLALHGRESVSPNPRVGCVVVKDGTVIGEGWHRCCGGPHAEVGALEGLSPAQAKGADLYVTLEPCAHQGRTPPCTQAIVAAGIKRVFVAIKDLNPLVAGRGIKHLRKAGVEVQANTHPKMGYWSNRRFFTFLNEKRPYIILKWAQSAEGYIAPKNNKRTEISNLYSRILSHSWRATEDAILVGYRTAYYDNPRLTTRYWQGKHPLRVVLDKHASLPATHRLLADKHPTLVYTTLPHHRTATTLTYQQVDEENYLQHVLQDLEKRQCLSLIVEGGSATLHAFLQRGLWDEIRIIHTKKILGKAGVPAPVPLDYLHKKTTTKCTQTLMGGDCLEWISKRKHLADEDNVLISLL